MESDHSEDERPPKVEDQDQESDQGTELKSDTESEDGNDHNHTAQPDDSSILPQSLKLSQSIEQSIIKTESHQEERAEPKIEKEEESFHQPPAQEKPEENRDKVSHSLQQQSKPQPKPQTNLQKKAEKKRQQKSNQPTSKATKRENSKPANDVIFQDTIEWGQDGVDSDKENIDDEIKMEEEKEEQPAILDQYQVSNITNRTEALQMPQQKQCIKHEYFIENKFLLVLFLLFKKEIYDLFPKTAFNRVDLHPANKNKIRIFGTNPQEIKEVSSKITQILDQTSIVKLNIRSQEAVRLKSSQMLNHKLFKDKLVMFSYGNSSERAYYLGGKGTQQQLSMKFKEIRNLKFRFFRMYDFPNTRSYNLIVRNFIQSNHILKAFIKWSLRSLELVDYIPDFTQQKSSKQKKQKEKSLCFLMATLGNMDNFSPKEIENSLSPYIKNNFYANVLIFRQGEKFLPKLNVEGITFKYVFERKYSWAYLFILSPKSDFFAKRDKIIEQIEEFSAKNFIYGVRYFNNISPQRPESTKTENYREIKFPSQRPYSVSVLASEVVTEESEGPKEGNTEKSEEKKKKIVYHKFDWKSHLMSLQQNEAKEETKARK